jgi:hypothetical protein
VDRPVEVGEHLLAALIPRTLVFEAMVKPTIASGAEDQLGEQIRKLRLRADGQRPLAVNLSETIVLTRKLFELREAAQRAR